MVTTHVRAFSVSRGVNLFDKTMVGLILTAQYVLTAYALWHWRSATWVDVVNFVLTYSLVAVGVSGGLHRLGAHESFQTSHVMRVILFALGAMALQGQVILWIFRHRVHHMSPDQPAHAGKIGDPHSPWTPHMGGLLGFLHSQWFWLFRVPSRADENHSIVKQLRADPALQFINRTYAMWPALRITIPSLISGAIACIGHEGSRFLVGLTHGIGVAVTAMCIGNIVTSLVNSWGHEGKIDETHPNDHSQNILLPLACGEERHGDHHRSPKSIYFGIPGRDRDLVGMVLFKLAERGLIWDLKVFDGTQIQTWFPLSEIERPKRLSGYLEALRVGADHAA